MNGALAANSSGEQTWPATSSPLVYRSAVMQRVCEAARRAARGNVKVLLTGESGVGKEVLARLIHQSSGRAERPFVAVNCGAFAEPLLESELFGHVKGSFTGAYRDKVGKLQMADGGTVFLDEVGEMAPRMQALLLRFLETGETQPVGADRPVRPADVRVISATNRDLQQEIKAGQFRLDLFYRLCVVHVDIPPLRARVEDIPPLVEHIVGRLARPVRLTAAAMAALEAHHWPGNVRELQNVIEHAAWAAAGETVDVADLPAPVGPASCSPLVPSMERRRQIADDLFEDLRDERVRFWNDVYPAFLKHDLTRRDIQGLVRRALAATSGDYRRALRFIGIDADDDRRFMNFLASHDCHVDARGFRKKGPAAGDGDHEAVRLFVLPTSGEVVRFPAGAAS